MRSKELVLWGDALGECFSTVEIPWEVTEQKHAQDQWHTWLRGVLEFWWEKPGCWHDRDQAPAWHQKRILNSPVWVPSPLSPWVYGDSCMTLSISMEIEWHLPEKGRPHYISWVQVDKVGNKNESQALLKRTGSVLWLTSLPYLPCLTQTKPIPPPAADKSCHGGNRAQE